LVADTHRLTLRVFSRDCSRLAARPHEKGLAPGPPLRPAFSRPASSNPLLYTYRFKSQGAIWKALLASTSRRGWPGIASRLPGVPRNGGRWTSYLYKCLEDPGPHRPIARDAIPKPWFPSFQRSGGTRGSGGRAKVRGR
jgi:hypothetical protein